MSMILAMAGIGMSFNANEHQERQIDALPAGWYPVQIVNSEVKPTKTPGGARLNLQFKILSGDFAGRVLFGGYNVQNSNPVAVQIAMEELAELSRAVAKPIWNDTQELHAIPFNLKVKVVPATAEYAEKNEPQQYKHITDMDKVVYATKADMKKGAAPVGAGFGQPQPGFSQPQPGFGQPQQQQQPQQSAPSWATNPQQQTQQQVQQPQQQQPQQGNVNFGQAAQTQPWQQPQQGQQPQQQAEQVQQPVQQQQVEQQPQQQAVQQQQEPVQQVQQVQQQQQPVQEQQVQQQQTQQQPTWAQQQVQPGTEQPQQVNTQQQVQEPADDIAQAAQSQTPPWKKPAQE